MSTLPNNLVLPQGYAAPRSERARALDGYLLGPLRELRRAYEQRGDPRIIYMAAAGIADQLRYASGARSSLQYSRLLAFLGEMRLNEGRDAPSLEVGLSLVREASEVLQRVNARSEETRRFLVNDALHEAVILKALGRPSEAIDEMRKRRAKLVSREGATVVDVLMLDRQEVLIHQDAAGFRRLAESASSYRNSHPAEYYGSVKRVFEFLLNSRRLDHARSLYPEFQRSFRAVRHRLPLLSHVSFLKNSGHYLAVARHERAGTRVLTSALSAAQRLNFHGQARQAEALLSVTSQADASLPTFRV